jgi:hypothetical protein
MTYGDAGQFINRENLERERLSSEEEASREDKCQERRRRRSLGERELGGRRRQIHVTNHNIHQKLLGTIET